ncbi:MAG: carboxypeptidase-like regulatory domain-containing protein, partial [Candidatus Acidiferrales bacterium]
MRFLAAGALALVMSFTIHAGQVADVKGDVSGSVKTAEGAALPGASVEAVSETGGKSYVTWTDSTGKFNFSGLPAGKYRVQANQLGFLQVALEISVPDEASKTISIVMRVATLAELSAPPGATAEKPKTASRTGGPESAAKPPTAGQPRRGNGGQAVPPGVANALHENLGGFQQTDLSGEQGAETTGAAAGSEQTAAAGNEAPQMSAAGAGAASDSFLLQGTVGQGATTGNTFGPGGPGGPGGPAGEGAAGLVPS